jgi:hypothetical protein
MTTAYSGLTLATSREDLGPPKLARTVFTRPGIGSVVVAIAV